MGFGTLVQRITYKISGRSASSSGLYTPSTYLYDYALGGIPFLSATNDTRPDIEKPVDQRKQQFDNFKDPGEYSLQQWWLRSQSSFTGGAGVLYQDPDTAGVSSGTSVNIRFNRSIGVDPFSDPGFLQLLPEVNQSVNYTGSHPGDIQVEWYQGPNEDRLWICDQNCVVTSAVIGTSDINTVGQRTVTFSNQGLVSNIVPFSNQGVDPLLYAMAGGVDAAQSGLWKIDDNNVALTATQIYKPAPIDNALWSMLNSRGFIYAGQRNKLWQLQPTAGAGTAWPATPVATIPADQMISCVADGPDAIYVSANGPQSGFIYKTTFDSSGAVNGLTQVAVLPFGEFVNQIASYVATYLVIATTISVRVGEFTGSGISYGPPLVTVPAESRTYAATGGSARGFGAISFFGTKAFIGTQTSAANSLHDGAQGTVCIDLGTVLQDNNTGAQFNPYCTWVYSPASVGRTASVTVDQVGRIIYTTSDTGGSPFIGKLWIQHASNLISSGYLDTGRVRFNTVEPKLFKYFSVRTPVPLQGQLTVAVLSENNSLTNYITYGPTFDPGTTDVPTPVPVGPQNWEALRFTLNRGATDPTIGAVLDSWQIKALPGTLKQRIIVKQFLCLNSEKDKSGQIIQGDTQALDKLTAIRQMCQRSDIVTFQDLVNNTSDQVIIDEYQFTMMTTPGPNKENYGGYLTVTLRTVADSVSPISIPGTDVDV